ncbi:aspartyl protease family protein [Psychroserpens mesophilus]|uniref:aspartyl protease family protein n=1 Tax=Psychroserpens mesophilus TaxID=325473 RepID=UPI003D64DAC3
MKRIIIFIVIFIIFNTCKSDDVTFISHNNVPIIQVEINGLPANLLVDTGASISVLDITTINHYGFIIDTSKELFIVSGVGGSTNGYHLLNVTICNTNGELITDDFNFRTINLSNQRFHTGIVGIIGADYLKQNDVIIDYNTQTIKNIK